jgi:hypothetical protein
VPSEQIGATGAGAIMVSIRFFFLTADMKYCPIIYIGFFENAFDCAAHNILRVIFLLGLKHTFYHFKL